MRTLQNILISLLIFSVMTVAQESKDPIASVTMSFGEVYIKHVDKNDWQITKVGMHIYEGDKMRTKDTGKAEVMFINGSIVFLGNDTEMEFLENEKDKSNQNSLFLFFGSIWNQVTEGSDYNIESVHALATVRGTYFNVSVKDLMEVWVKEGQVDIENQYGKVEAEENTYVKVSKAVAPVLEEVDEESFPDDISFETDIVIETNLVSQVFKQEWNVVTGIIREKDNNMLYTDPIEITIAGSDNLVLKKKKGEKPKQAIMIEPKNGKFKFYILAKEDNESFTISSAKTTSQTLYVVASDEAQKKDVLIEFRNKKGQVKRLKATFEKQE